MRPVHSGFVSQPVWDQHLFSENPPRHAPWRRPPHTFFSPTRARSWNSELDQPRPDRGREPLEFAKPRPRNTLFPPGRADCEGSYPSLPLSLSLFLFLSRIPSLRPSFCRVLLPPPLSASSLPFAPPLSQRPSIAVSFRFGAQLFHSPVFVAGTTVCPHEICNPCRYLVFSFSLFVAGLGQQCRHTCEGRCEPPFLPHAPA